MLINCENMKTKQKAASPGLRTSTGFPFFYQKNIHLSSFYFNNKQSQQATSLETTTDQLTYIEGSLLKLIHS